MQATKDPKSLCPEVIRKDLQNMITDALLERFLKRLNPGEKITVKGFTGFECAFLEIRIGTEQKTHLFEFFAKNMRGDELDGALGLIVDYADGILEEFFRFKRNRSFPIDFVQREYDGHPVFARHELINPSATEMADDLLKKDK
ncbi:MAG: hypothetical protein KC505_06385 [Myxococcales bacterium]|nr:hypothetical protein [Myxococcales bacterium]USN51014.1 MAG: hypothetical protein H6731_00960 [Myxococcales bacterium]